MTRDDTVKDLLELYAPADDGLRPDGATIGRMADELDSRGMTVETTPVELLNALAIGDY